MRDDGTWSPTSSITPAPSLWGMTRGKGIPTPKVFWRFFTSPGLTPETATLMRTSLGRGTGVVISPTMRTSDGEPCCSYQAAFMVGHINLLEVGITHG